MHLLGRHFLEGGGGGPGVRRRKWLCVWCQVALFSTRLQWGFFLMQYNTSVGEVIICFGCGYLLCTSNPSKAKVLISQTSSIYFWIYQLPGLNLIQGYIPGEAVSPAGLEEVSMNWIGRQRVTQLKVSLNWMKLNKHFWKMIFNLNYDGILVKNIYINWKNLSIFWKIIRRFTFEQGGGGVQKVNRRFTFSNTFLLLLQPSLILARPSKSEFFCVNRILRDSILRGVMR